MNRESRRPLVPAAVRALLSRALVALVALAGGCTGTLAIDDNPPPPASPDLLAVEQPDLAPAPPVENFPFEAVAPRVYVGKVKNLLLGQAPTEDEIAAVTKDPTALRGLVDAWFVKPEAQAKLFSLFQKTFQQTQVLPGDFVDQTGLGGIGGLLSNLPQFAQSQESFARTAQRIVAEARPFTDTVTTHTIMMTPALMSLYLMMDQMFVEDSGATSVSVPGPDGQTLLDKVDYYVTYVDKMNGGPLTLQQALDPNSPSYLHFAAPAAFSCNVPQLDNTGHVVLDGNGKPVQVKVTYPERHYKTPAALFAALFGAAPGSVDGSNGNGPPTIVIPNDVPANMRGLYNYFCGGTATYAPPHVTAEDSVWRPVTIRVAQAGDPLVPFYDLPTLRQANEIVVRAPRVGFFSTPAFFANWQTNKSNQHRDTLNQSLIVGLGRSINPVDKGTSTVLDNGKDGLHSDPSSPCYSCHQTMDPMRNVFRQVFTYSYHGQHDPAQRFSTAVYDYLGTRADLASLDDFADTLVRDPHYPIAWAQKLCYYANSGACSEDDPEFLRVVKAFTDSRHDFHRLVTELFSSPLVTGASKTKTWTDLGESLSVARQDHLCAALTNRLGLAQGVCVKITNGTTALAVANNIPLDGYLRGAEAPALSTEPTLFFRGAAEALCSYAADLTVDVNMASRYHAAMKDAAITDLVASIMGIASGDPDSATVTKLLADHYDAAVAAGATPKDALKSTFIVACLSPTSIAMGM